MQLIKDITCTIIEIKVFGVVTTYTKNEWVNEKNPESGDYGYYVTVQKKLDEPMFSMQFKAMVNKSLEKGCIYADTLGNRYIAIDERTINLLDTAVNRFEIPKDLCVIYKAAYEH